MKGKEISKCAYCGKKPTIIRLPGDLFYAQCVHEKQGAYDYLGITRNQCIDIWNKAQYSLAKYQKEGKDELC
jgi:hypothetical protein